MNNMYIIHGILNAKRFNKIYQHIYLRTTNQINKLINALNTVFRANVIPDTFQYIDEMVFVYQPDGKKKTNLKGTLVEISVIYFPRKPNLNSLFAQSAAIKFVGKNNPYMYYIIPYVT
jgi:hypothetical protein